MFHHNILFINILSKKVKDVMDEMWYKKLKFRMRNLNIKNTNNV